MTKSFAARLCALLLAVFALSGAAATPARIEGSDSAVLTGDSPSVVFLNTFTGAGYWTYPRGQWVAVDLKPYGVPPDATAALLHGLLIISMGSAPDSALVSVHFRRPGSGADCANSTAYADIFNVPSGSVRAPIMDIVPLENGIMEVCIKTKWGSPGNGIALHDWEASFGAFPSFGVNVRLRGWLR